LKFLATHPQKINGAFQTAVMAPGVMSAFQQTGRQIPPVNDIGSNRGSLGYWLSHKGSYHGVGAGLGAEAMARALGGVARRMLRGQGIRISDVQHPNTIITDRNLSDWAQPGWTLTTPGIAEGPAEQFMSDEFLNGLFAQGETPK
jgi:ribose transport system substrate-binding protein